RLGRFDELIDRYDGLPGNPTDAEHTLILQQAELVVATSPTTPVPPNFKTVVLGRRAAFAQKRAQFRALAATTATTLSQLLGAVARVLPEIALDAAHGAEWRSAVLASESGAPFAHLAADHDAPVDDWLHGLARVREKLGHWERQLLMSAPLGLGEAGLTPIQ